MISIEYCPTSFFSFMFSSSRKLDSIFPSSDTSLTWGHMEKKKSTFLTLHVNLPDNIGNYFGCLCATFPEHSTHAPFMDQRAVVTWDLTNLWRFSIKPLASGVITSTVKWASNSKHTQSMIYSKMQSDGRDISAPVNTILPFLHRCRSIFCLQNSEWIPEWLMLLQLHRYAECGLIKTPIQTSVRLGDLTPGSCGDASWQYLR